MDPERVPGGRPRGRRPDRRLPRATSSATRSCRRSSPGRSPPLLPAAAPDEPEPLDAILADVDRAGRSRTRPTGSTRASSRTSRRPRPGPGSSGEMLTAALGQNAMLWRTSPIGDGARGRRGRLAARGARACPTRSTACSPTPPRRSTLIALAAAREAAGLDAAAAGPGGADDLGAVRGSTPRRRRTARSRRRA